MGLDSAWQLAHHPAFDVWLHAVKTHTNWDDSTVQRVQSRDALLDQLARKNAHGDDQGCDDQRLVSQTMDRPFVADGGFGLGRKTRGM